jgi:hypothetical protein
MRPAAQGQRMKTLVTLIAVCIVGYWLYTFYSQNPDDLPSMVHRQKDLVSTPIPDEKAIAQTAPKLDSIQVIRGPVLTHAKVKSARVNSIVFMCDQGIFEVNYDRLPPEFQGYYMPSPSVAAAQAVAAVESAVAPAPAPAPAPRPEPQRSYEEDMNARLNFVSSKAGLEARQQSDLDTITKWYKQSNFEPGGLSQGQFDTAKADYDAATAQLNTLVAQGPR